MMVDHDWMTVQEAARLTKYRADHLRELIRDGKIQARKFGPIWAVHRQSLLKYMDAAVASNDRRHGPKPRRKSRKDVI